MRVVKGLEVDGAALLLNVDSKAQDILTEFKAKGGGTTPLEVTLVILGLLLFPPC
jgi:hypothetical protein